MAHAPNNQRVCALIRRSSVVSNRASGLQLDETDPELRKALPVAAVLDRSTYDGPLSMADDYIVWNVTQDEIRVREVHYNPNVWPPPKAFPSPDIDQSNMLGLCPRKSHPENSSRPSRWIS